MSTHRLALNDARAVNLYFVLDSIKDAYFALRPRPLRDSRLRERGAAARTRERIRRPE